jgi:hypothetical protein
MTDESHEDRNAVFAGSVSRRRALVQSSGGVAAIACALGGCATSQKVQGKMPQVDAQYQVHPSGLERCGVCKHFIPSSGCEIVVAPVQANGWCKFYTLFG